MDLKTVEISPWIAWFRKVRVLSTVTRCGFGGPLAVDDFLARVAALRKEAVAEASPFRKIERLWQIEGLAYRYFEGNDSPISLTGCLPAEANPPAHCGLGMATVLNYGFDAGKIREYIESAADGNYVRAAYESVGVMLGTAERDFFGRLTALLGRLRIIRRSSFAAPDPESFVAQFSEDTREFISHGFGRLLYFKKHRLSSAVLRARRIPYLSETACIHGAVGAYTLVNSRDLRRVLRIADVDEGSLVEEALRAGLFNTLLLLEWTTPGCLVDLEPESAQARELIGRAAEFAHWVREQNRGPLFVA